MQENSSCACYNHGGNAEETGNRPQTGGEISRTHICLFPHSVGLGNFLFVVICYLTFATCSLPFPLHLFKCYCLQEDKIKQIHLDDDGDGVNSSCLGKNPCCLQLFTRQLTFAF